VQITDSNIWQKSQELGQDNGLRALPVRKKRVEINIKAVTVGH
jgi:hypothetical protein